MKFKNLIPFSIGSALLIVTHSASAQFFTTGDLVVSTYGSLTSATLLDGQATPITLLDYSLPTATSISLTMSDQLPITGTGANVGIIGEYGSSSEGTIQVSGNGQYLTIGGYDGNLAANGGPYGGGHTAEAQSTDTNVPRVAAVINIATGAVDTSTVLNDIYNTNNPRAVYSPDGTSLYLSGQGANASDEGGLYLTSKGTNTTTGGAAPTPIFNAVSTRTITQAFYNANGTASAVANTFYAADQNSGKGVLTGIFEYAGSPTSSQGSNTGTQLTPASGTVNGTATNFSPEAFAFANATTLYVADTGDPKAGGVGDGGIQKWVFSGGSWNLAYTLRPSTFVPTTTATSVSSGETGFESMALRLDGNGNVDIYATSYTAGDANPNGLYAVVDNVSFTTAAQASGESVVELAVASGSTNANGEDANFKGVALVPTPEPTTAISLVGGLGVLLGMSRRRGRSSVPAGR